MADWEKIDPRKVDSDALKGAAKEAAENVRLSRTLLKLTVRTGRVLVTYGPMPIPVDDLPQSALPRCYMVYWYGNHGAPYPPEVDDHVLIRTGRGTTKGQVWAVESAAEAARIIKDAFGLDVAVPDASAVRS